MNIVGPILFFLLTQLTVPEMGDNSVQIHTLAAESISLENRYANEFVNDVFKDNILLTLHYWSGKVTKKDEINWDEIRKPVDFSFVLQPNETFAFHDDVLSKYKNTVVKTTNARFNFDDGFKSDGYLMGDGVCHLASLVYWVSKNAGLDAYAPTNHNFAIIPEIVKEFGVAIYKMPGQETANAMQNLYVTNNKDKAIIFKVSYKDRLEISIGEL